MTAILVADPARWRALQTVSALSPTTCWIGAGFVRNAVWANLHGSPSPVEAADVDVVHYSPEAAAALDTAVETSLTRQAPAYRWSVKNQALMAARNGDCPYCSLEEALRHWPETATAVAVRLDHGKLSLCAPYGLEDLFDLVLRPTPDFRATKAAPFERRLNEKQWLTLWPRLRRRDA
ncbi:hypothetical protein GGD83_000707 [Rhodoblastus sphagnicola]|uniref:nucleotidyltransferase family protein n=1 Tax=Rhodoblastus sphagnicola TaxID=333368 RepID=UPI0017C9048D|nr:nucleotidyltransferase family protein [Rhodoblastus sphagnicola]MBB4196930.1 hypothetical protein [Rhodoblastus sphagnicola]